MGDWWRGVPFFIFRVSPGYRRKHMSCLALFCLAAAAATTAADSAGLAAAVAAAKPSPHRAALARHEGFHRGLEPWPRSVPGTGSLFRPYTYIFG